MADTKWRTLEKRLKEIDCDFAFWGRSELRELADVLLPGEIVQHCINGTYEGGFAMLVATDQRVLLIDKKPMYLTLEDVRFDMVSEVDYNHRLLNSTIFIRTPNKCLRFTGYNHERSRLMFHYVQTRVAEIRQHFTMLQQSAEVAPLPASGTTVPGRLAGPPITAQATAPNSSLTVANPGQQQAITRTSEEANSVSPVSAGYSVDDEQLAGSATSEAAEAPLSTLTYQATITRAAAYRTVVPIIGTYTRTPLVSNQSRFLGARALSTAMPPMYQQQN